MGKWVMEFRNQKVAERVARRLRRRLPSVQVRRQGAWVEVHGLTAKPWAILGVAPIWGPAPAACSCSLCWLAEKNE